MAIKAIVDSLDGIADGLKEHYAEKDGKFVLSVEAVNGFALEDVSGLKSALGKERTSREILERQVVAFKDLDPEKARAALAELETLKAIDPTKEADKLANSKFEAAKAQLLDKHQGEIGQREDRIKFLTGTVDEMVRQQRATAAIAEAKGAVDLLLPHVLKNTRTVEKDGKFIVEVVDADGNIRIADGKGTPMDIAGLVAEMRGSDKFARAFDGDGQSGSGKQHDSSGAQPKGKLDGDKADRSAYWANKFKLPATN